MFIFHEIQNTYITLNWNGHLLVCITLCHTSTCNLNTIVTCTVQSCKSSLCHWKWTTKTNTEWLLINQLYFFSVCCVNLVSLTETKLTSSFGSSMQRSDFQRKGLIYPSLFSFTFISRLSSSSSEKQKYWLTVGLMTLSWDQFL